MAGYLAAAAKRLNPQQLAGVAQRTATQIRQASNVATTPKIERTSEEKKQTTEIIGCFLGNGIQRQTSTPELMKMAQAHTSDPEKVRDIVAEARNAQKDCIKKINDQERFDAIVFASLRITTTDKGTTTSTRIKMDLFHTSAS